MMWVQVKLIGRLSWSRWLIRGSECTENFVPTCKGPRQKSPQDYFHNLLFWSRDGNATSFAHGNVRIAVVFPGLLLRSVRLWNIFALATLRFFGRRSWNRLVICIICHHSPKRSRHVDISLTINCRISKVVILKKKKKHLHHLQGMRFTQEFFIPLSSYLPFPSTRGSICFVSPRLKLIQ